MNGIIKRRKTADYAQIHNNALQNLEDIRSIGLISHLMSLPENWVIKKMQLYNKFGRGPITNAIKELEEKRYWVDIKYRDGKKNLHFYNVSDIPFNNEEVAEFIQEVTSSGYKIMEISSPFSHLISGAENQQLNKSAKEGNSSSVGNEQLNMNSSNSIVEDRHLLNKNEKTNIDKQNKNKETLLINNGFLNTSKFKVALIDACNSFYTEFAPGRWSKKQWLTLIETFVNETVEKGRYNNIPIDKIRGYAFQSIKNMAYKFDLKNSNMGGDNNQNSILYYNWLGEVDNNTFV